MKVAAVIAEFNPFHNGHAYMLREVRRLSGADYVIVAMSGSFVQRGAPAVVDPFLRTQMALDGGADLVLELPCAVSTGSAGVFAAGAAALLERTGLVDELWFGSEYGEIAPFLQLADLLAEEPEAFSACLRKGLASGMTYPAAREAAAVRCLSGGVQDVRELLSAPNNILGLEYCIALKRTGSSIRPRTLLRAGAGYHDRSTGCGSTFSSAEAVREQLFRCGQNAAEHNAEQPDLPECRMERVKNNAGLPEWSLAVPEGTAAVLRAEAKRNGLLRTDDFSDMLFYQLTRDMDCLEQYEGVTEELANRIRKQSRHTATFDGLAERVKSKNYTWTQISRALTHILLQIRPENTEAACSAPYIRVLGFSADVLPGLLTGNASVPVCMGAASIPDPYRAQALFAAHLYERVLVKKTGASFRHLYERKLVVSG